MCPHERILDDRHTADMICVDCGVVVDRIYGQPGGQVWSRSPEEKTGERWQMGGKGVLSVDGVTHRLPPVWVQKQQREKGEEVKNSSWWILDPFAAVMQWAELYEKRQQVVDLLRHFGIESDTVVDNVLELYNKIYGFRKEGKNGFRKTEAREVLALAFSVTNILTRMGFPRPPGYVARVCGLHEPGWMLQIEKRLALSPEEKESLQREDYELEEAEPWQYVDTLCAHLGISFTVSTKTQTLLEREELKWCLQGHKPTLITAAALLLCNEGRMAKEIASALDCTLRSVQSIQKRMEALLQGCI